MKHQLSWIAMLGLPCLILLGVFIYAQSASVADRQQATSGVAGAPVRVVHNSGMVDEPAAGKRNRVLEGPPAPEVPLGKIVQEGIAVELSMARVGTGEREEFQEGDDVRFRFRITDTTSDAPLTSVYPAAWLVDRETGTVTSSVLAAKKAEALVNSSVFTPADLDLNVYYVVTLNSDATITVVDPLFGYGTTKLLALIQLKTPGADWALSADDATLYVSLPESHEVAVIDTRTWELREYVGGGRIPDRLALQPDGHYLWVCGGGSGPLAEDSGVTILNTETLEVAARIRTGRGRHDIAFSDDSRIAFVTNSEQNTVTIIDIRTLQVRADVASGQNPVSIDFSTVGQLAYVTHAGDGTIAVVSGERGRVVKRLSADKGLGQIKFAPNGRHAFVVNPDEDTLYIVDAATNQIVQSGKLEAGPDQLAFSDELAYVRHQDSPNVLMIPLDAIGAEGQKIPLIDFPAGQAPPGRMSRRCLAPTMVQAPGASAMLVANPTDQAVYFYKEGMAAPMGTFSNYSREPLAVSVVDRSLRERADSGIYETVARLPAPNSYDVVFFLDAPRIVHCFPLEVHADAELQHARNVGKVDITHSVDSTKLAVGKPTSIRFALHDRNSGAAKSGLEDVQIQTFLVPGIWNRRHLATEVEPGVYAIDFVPREAGIYYISVASDSIGVNHNNPHLLILRATHDVPASDVRAHDVPADSVTASDAATNE